MLQANDDNDRHTESILKFQIEKHFLLLSDSCLYMVHLGLGPFLPEVTEGGNIGSFKSKPKCCSFLLYFVKYGSIL